MFGDSTQILKRAVTGWSPPWRTNRTCLNQLRALDQWGRAWTHPAPASGEPPQEKVPNQVSWSVNIIFDLLSTFFFLLQCIYSWAPKAKSLFVNLVILDLVLSVNPALLCPAGLTEAGTGSTLKGSLCSLSDISDSEDISNKHWSGDVAVRQGPTQRPHAPRLQSTPSRHLSYCYYMEAMRQRAILNCNRLFSNLIEKWDYSSVTWCLVPIICLP